MSARVKISFITTILNEELTILSLLNSLNSQVKLPDEVVIVDGGSTDNTVKKIVEFQKSKQNKLKIKLIKAKGNRSIGRNIAIKHSNTEIIAISDAGCTLDKNWLKEITKPFEDKAVDVIAGYYKGKAQTSFQKALIPYVLVMNPNPDTFLPATRSMAMRRKVWKELGGFDEKLSNNEDYVFAKKIKRMEYKIYFAKRAIVFWIPRDNLKDAFNMFYRFAKGDSEAGIIRKKVVLIFARYMIGVLLLFLLPTLALVMLCFYGIWSGVKNYRNARSITSVAWLPIIQFTSDIAVMSGTIIGKI